MIARGGIKTASSLVAHEAGLAQVKVFDMNGHLVASVSRYVPAGTIDLKNMVGRLPEGIYTVRVRLNGRTDYCMVPFSRLRTGM